MPHPRHKPKPTPEKRSDIYDPLSQAILQMAEEFEGGNVGNLTPIQMRTIAFALRALHPNKDWAAGFLACAYLFAGHYDRYIIERDAKSQPEH